MPKWSYFVIPVCLFILGSISFGWTIYERWPLEICLSSACGESLLSYYSFPLKVYSACVITSGIFIAAYRANQAEKQLKFQSEQIIAGRRDQIKTEFKDKTKLLDLEKSTFKSMEFQFSDNRHIIFKNLEKGERDFDIRIEKWIEEYDQLISQLSEIHTTIVLNTKDLLRFNTYSGIYNKQRDIFSTLFIYDSQLLSRREPSNDVYLGEPLPNSSGITHGQLFSNFLDDGFLILKTLNDFNYQENVPRPRISFMKDAIKAFKSHSNNSKKAVDHVTFFESSVHDWFIQSARREELQGSLDNMNKDEKEILIELMSRQPENEWSKGKTNFMNHYRPIYCP